MDIEVFITGVQACAIAAEGHVSSATTPFTPLTGLTCNTICGSTSTSCTLPGDILHAYLAGQAREVEAGGAFLDASADAIDALSETGSSEAGNEGDSSTAGCPGIAPTAAVLLDCTTTCAR
jgi:hypothetical protein